jgi:hypothetical protein
VSDGHDLPAERLRPAALYARSGAVGHAGSRHEPGDRQWHHRYSMGSLMRVRSHFFGFLLFGLLVPVSASAQQRRRVTYEEIVIQGEIKKPEITIFITRQNLATDYSLELRESFVPKIVESVEKKPF